MVFFTYADRPGVVGIVGQILGAEGINIAGMQVCRDARGGHALIVLTVDSALPPDGPGPRSPPRSAPSSAGPST